LLPGSLPVPVPVPVPRRSPRTGQVRSPQGWGASVTGDFNTFDGAPTLSFARSLSEVLEDADGAFFVTGVACCAT
jgi:hypothetical protein